MLKGIKQYVYMKEALYSHPSTRLILVPCWSLRGSHTLCHRLHVSEAMGYTCKHSKDC